MTPADSLTPARLFASFGHERSERGHEAVRAFQELPPEERAAFLEPVLAFLRRETRDHVRSWATTVLMHIGGEAAFGALAELLQEAPAPGRDSARTRFFALRGLATLAQSEAEKATLLSHAGRLASDPAEGPLARAGARLVRCRAGLDAAEGLRADLRRVRTDPEATVHEVLAVLRAAQEFPVAELAHAIIEVLSLSPFFEHKLQAIRALRDAVHGGDIEVRSALSLVVEDDPSPHLRLEAVLSLAEHEDPEAVHTLYKALAFRDAEVRVQAALALQRCLGTEDAVELLCERALDSEDEPSLRFLIGALREIDEDRSVCSRFLTDALGDPKRDRAGRAETILARLGGWEAVRRLGDRRSLLESLDKYLVQSEEVVRALFDDTIRHAQFNFRFAMAVNIAITVLGVVLMGIALNQLIQHPDDLKSWLLPGGSGSLAVILVQYFNNPRKAAARDLTTLLNANVIFLGFLRQVNEIDATFKHAYIEDDEFGPEQMKETVGRLDAVVERTLEMATTYLAVSAGKEVAKTDGE